MTYKVPRGYTPISNKLLNKLIQASDKAIDQFWADSCVHNQVTINNLAHWTKKLKQEFKFGKEIRDFMEGKCSIILFPREGKASHD